MRALLPDEFAACARMFREPTPETIASLSEDVLRRLMARGLLTYDAAMELFVWNHATLSAYQCTWLAAQTWELG